MAGDGGIACCDRGDKENGAYKIGEANKGEGDWVRENHRQRSGRSRRASTWGLNVMRRGLASSHGFPSRHRRAARPPLHAASARLGACTSRRHRTLPSTAPSAGPAGGCVGTMIPLAPSPLGWGKPLGPHRLHFLWSKEAAAPGMPWWSVVEEGGSRRRGGRGGGWASS